MSDVKPPDVGQVLWGDDLNTYLLALEDRLVEVSVELANQEARITALEAQPEHIYASAPWMFSSSAPPAGNNQVRLNNIDQSLATLIDLRRIDSDGADRSAAMQLVDGGSMLRISDWNEATIYHQFRPTGPATFTTDNAQIPVTWVEGNGLLPNGKVNVGFLLEPPF